MTGARCPMWAGLLLLAWIIVGWTAVAQEPILTVSFERDELTIPRGGVAAARLRLVNRSVHTADDIELFLVDGDGIEMGTVEPVLELRPFSEVVLEVPLSVPDALGEGTSNLQFELAHTYCIGDLCFYIFEPVELRVVRAEPEETAVPAVDAQIEQTSEGVDGTRLWRNVLPLALAAVLIVALSVAALGRLSGGVKLILLAVAGIALGYGIALQQAHQAQSIGAVLCTSCVGIEETPHEPPNLSQAAQARIAALQSPVDLLLFSAVWCHSCPYAKAMVDQVVAAGDRVTVRVVDVDEDRAAAEAHGVVQSGRAIVPAIVRLGTNEVLFGIDRLESRLLTLLEASP